MTILTTLSAFLIHENPVLRVATVVFSPDFNKAFTASSLKQQSLIFNAQRELKLKGGGGKIAQSATKGHSK